MSASKSMGGLALFQIVYALIWAAAIVGASMYFDGSDFNFNEIMPWALVGYVLSNGLLSALLFSRAG